MAKRKLGSVKTTDQAIITSADLVSDVTGILGVANGGTGQSTFTNGQLLIGNTTGNTLAKAAPTAGAGMAITLGAGSLTFATSLATSDLPAFSGLTATDIALDDSLPLYDLSATANRALSVDRLLGFLDFPCQGRLTTESGVAVSTSDRTAQSTIYFTPFNGNRVALFDGTRWRLYSLTERSLALSGLTSGLNYDVFLYDNSGTLTLELTAWSSNTARATALTTQDGVFVRSGATTRRYLGTIRTTGTTTTEDSEGGSTTNVGGKRFVWNYYNRVRRNIRVIDDANLWSYGTGTWRQANANTGNKVEFVWGWAEQAIDCWVHGIVALDTNSARAAKVGVGVDSTTTPSGIVQGGYSTGSTTFAYKPVTARYVGFPSVGYHALNWIENGADGTCLFLGDNGGDGQQSGMVATVWM